MAKLVLGENDGRAYGDAQLDDYHVDGVMRWRPPVRMRLRARFSHSEAVLQGTAGFGFWNDPFGMTRGVKSVPWLPRLRLPQAVVLFCVASVGYGIGVGCCRVWLEGGDN